MKLRSPSGRVITNRLIKSKLQERQENLIYSSSVASPLNFYDLAWMDSFLIAKGLFLKFITLHQQTINQSVRQLVRGLKKTQIDEFFAENTRFSLLRKTGIRLGVKDLEGGWHRKVDFDLISLKLLFTSHLVLSSENLFKNRSDFRPFDLVGERWSMARIDDGASTTQRFDSVDSLVAGLINLYTLSRHDSECSFLFRRGDGAFLVNMGHSFDHSVALGSKVQVKMDATQCSNGVFDRLVVGDGEGSALIELDRITWLIKGFPGLNQFDMCQNFTQKALSGHGLELSYDQHRFIMMFSFLLSLHNLVKLETC